MQSIQRALSLLASKTLVHGTCTFHEESIRAFGLLPGVGPNASGAYEEYEEAGIELPELVFAAEKRDVDRSLTAMVSCIANGLGTDLHAVTDSQIRAYGLLAVMSGEGGEADVPGWQYAEEGTERYEHQREEYPQAEPGDYFSEGVEHPTYLLKGSALVRYLRRYGAWPRTWGPSEEENLREHLTRMVVQQHPERAKTEIVQKVKNLSGRELRDYYYTYRKMEEGAEA